MRKRKSRLTFSSNLASSSAKLNHCSSVRMVMQLLISLGVKLSAWKEFNSRMNSSTGTFVRSRVKIDPLDIVAQRVPRAATRKLVQRMCAARGQRAKTRLKMIFFPKSLSTVKNVGRPFCDSLLPLLQHDLPRVSTSFNKEQQRCPKHSKAAPTLPSECICLCGCLCYEELQFPKFITCCASFFFLPPPHPYKGLSLHLSNCRHFYLCTFLSVFLPLLILKWVVV
jgi:hypothetical protein